MDMSAMLPLLMGMSKKNANGEGEAQGGGMMSPENMQLLMSALKGGNADPAQLITQLASKQNPELAKIMSLANLNAPKKPSPQGLGAIKSFASNDITGRLAKFFAR